MGKKKKAKRARRRRTVTAAVATAILGAAVGYITGRRDRNHVIVQRLPVGVP